MIITLNKADLNDSTVMDQFTTEIIANRTNYIGWNYITELNTAFLEVESIINFSFLDKWGIVNNSNC